MVKVWNDPRSFAVALGMDAFRLASGGKLKNFTPQQVVGLLTEVANQDQPIRPIQAVLDAHAQFGGDLEDMHRRYERHYDLVFALSISERTE